MLNPAGPGEMLPVFELVAAGRLPLVIEEDAAGAGGALVYGGDVFRHLISIRTLRPLESCSTHFRRRPEECQRRAQGWTLKKDLSFRKAVQPINGSMQHH